MPFYRVNGMVMHIKFGGRRKPPAPCVAKVQESTGTMVCCCDISSYLCDWKVGESTCDAPLCENHAHQVGRNRHFCPKHHAEHTHQSPQRGLFTGLEVSK